MVSESQSGRSQRLIAACNTSHDERQQIRALLKKVGFAVVTYHSPQEMIDNLNVVMPRVILFDADELGIGRFEMCKQIRAHHPDLTAPIIFLSKSTARSDVTRAKQAGVQDYLVKPICPDALIKRLDHWSGIRIARRFQAAG